MQTLTLDDDSPDEVPTPVHEYMSEETMPFGGQLPDEVELEVYPLTKKPGASFPDRITIGRTAEQRHRDRRHLGVAAPRVRRADANGWVVADAGSKNGS